KARLQLAAEQQCAEDRKHQCANAANPERAPYEPFDLEAVAHIAADHEGRAVRQQQRQDSADRRSSITPKTSGFEEPGLAVGGRPTIEITGQLASVSAKQQIDFGVLLDPIRQQALDLLL